MPILTIYLVFLCWVFARRVSGGKCKAWCMPEAFTLYFYINFTRPYMYCMHSNILDKNKLKTIVRV